MNTNKRMQRQSQSISISRCHCVRLDVLSLTRASRFAHDFISTNTLKNYSKKFFWSLTTYATNSKPWIPSSRSESERWQSEKKAMTRRVHRVFDVFKHSLCYGNVGGISARMVNLEMTNTNAKDRHITQRWRQCDDDIAQKNQPTNITKTFYFYENSKHFFLPLFVRFWFVHVCECGRLIQTARQLYGCSGIIRMCSIRPIKTILQFQLAHLHEPIFITS